jgi:hypothetical protein
MCCTWTCLRRLCPILYKMRPAICLLIPATCWRDGGITEPLVPRTSPCDVDIATVKFQSYKSPGTDQILADLIQPQLINHIWNKKELPPRRKASIIVRIYKKDDKTDGRNYRDKSLLSIWKQLLSPITFTQKVRSIHRQNFWRSSM